MPVHRARHNVDAMRISELPECFRYYAFTAKTKVSIYEFAQVAKRLHPNEPIFDRQKIQGR